jgi:hypothetical protein
VLNRPDAAARRERLLRDIPTRGCHLAITPASRDRDRRGDGLPAVLNGLLHER